MSGIFTTHIYIQQRLFSISQFLSFGTQKRALSCAFRCVWRGLYCADAHLDANDADGPKRFHPSTASAHHVRTSGYWDAIHSPEKGNDMADMANKHWIFQ